MRFIPIWCIHIRNREVSMSSQTITGITLLSLLLIGCGPEATDSKEEGNQKGNDNARVFQVDATAWEKEIRADREKASEKYVGAEIELTGEVGRVDATQKVLWLANGNSPVGTICHFSDGSVLADVSPKQKITVRGVCHRTMTLQNSEIVSISSDSVQTKTADEWIAVFLAGKEEFLDREDGRRWKVQGEIQKIEQAAGKDAVIVFKTESDVDFRVELDLYERPQPGQLKIGQKIELAGDLMAFISDETVLYLGNGAMIK